MFKTKNAVSYFRNFIFGVEDSLVSTVGLLSGIAIANIPRETIFLTGVVLIFVEAFSMAVGSFLSESTAQDYEDKGEHSEKKNVIAGIVMFSSYFISGFIPLIPYLIWPTSLALKFSIVFSVVALFVLGVVGSRIIKTSFCKLGLKMMLLGGGAILVGVLVGNLMS